MKNCEIEAKRVVLRVSGGSLFISINGALLFYLLKFCNIYEIYLQWTLHAIYDSYISQCAMSFITNSFSSMPPSNAIR